jgi:hypothetical protein
MKDIAIEVIDRYNGGYPIDAVFFPFLAALQNPEIREFYTIFINKINKLLDTNSRALEYSDKRIFHMMHISAPLFASNMNEEDKIRVMLFAATCSELELEVWRMMRQGKSPDLIESRDLNDCLLTDMGLSPRETENIIMMKAMDAQPKNEKLREATRKVENFFRAIAVEANDL